MKKSGNQGNNNIIMLLKMTQEKEKIFEGYEATSMTRLKIFFMNRESIWVLNV